MSPAVRCGIPTTLPAKSATAARVTAWFCDGVAGNVILRRTYGSDAIRFLNCRACKAQFSARRGTPFFDLRLPKAKLIDVVKHLAERVGLRKTARLTNDTGSTRRRCAVSRGERDHRHLHLRTGCIVTTMRRTVGFPTRAGHSAIADGSGLSLRRGRAVRRTVGAAGPPPGDRRASQPECDPVVARPGPTRFHPTTVSQRRSEDRDGIPKVKGLVDI
jgi:hypothetical protein